MVDDNNTCEPDDDDGAVVEFVLVVIPKAVAVSKCVVVVRSSDKGGKGCKLLIADGVVGTGNEYKIVLVLLLLPFVCAPTLFERLADDADDDFK